MRRRNFISLIGGAVAWPLAAHAQQPAMPVIGFLASATPEGFADQRRGFRQGLKDSGYIEGETVAVAYRWAENRPDRLPELAADLVRRQVAVIATAGHDAAFAAKAATSTIPILFIAGFDGPTVGALHGAGNLCGAAFCRSWRLDELRGEPD
jgi:putative ABC transport system substrate-binding protein